MLSLYEVHSQDIELQRLKSTLLNESLILSSGRHTYAFDNRVVLLSGYAGLAAKYLWPEIKKLKPNAVYGKGVGAMPLLLAIQAEAHKESAELDILFVRDQRKDRNQRRLVEGKTFTNEITAVYVDDLINQGTTLKQTFDDLKHEGYKVKLVGIACLVDFWKGEGTRQYEAMGIPVIRLFRRHDFGLTRQDPEGKTFLKRAWWNYTLNTDPPEGDYIVKSVPTFRDGLGYIGTDRSKFFCFDAKTGDIKWEHELYLKRGKGISNHALVTQDKVLFGGYDGSLYCLNRLDGKSIWNIWLHNSIHSSPVLDDKRNIVYIGTEHNEREGFAPGDYYGIGDLVALDCSTGAVLWRHRTGGMVPCTPAVSPEHNIVVVGSNDCFLYAVSDGKELWKAPTAGEVKGRPLIAHGKVFVGTSRLGIQVFDLFTGKELYTLRCGSLWHAFPLLTESDKVVVINGNGVVIGLNPHSLRLDWVTQTRSRGGYGVTLLPNDKLFVTSGNNSTFHLLKGSTGEKVWTGTNQPATRQPAAFYQDLLYIPTNRLGLQAFNLDKKLLGA